MKYCCTYTPKRYKIKRKFKVGIALVLVGILALVIALDGYIRSIIREYPMSVATGVMLELMDEAMQNILDETDFDPCAVDNVVYGEDGSVLSIETDMPTITGLKTGFTSQLSELLKNKGNTMTVRVPLGTLIGNEYTIGRGPEVSFDLRYSTTVTTNLQSSFTEAGINNTMHTITMNVTNNIFIVIPWGNYSKNVSTKYILAETVIVGKVPEAFTSVYDGSGSIVDDIFDHAAEVE